MTCSASFIIDAPSAVTVVPTIRLESPTPAFFNSAFHKLKVSSQVFKKRNRQAGWKWYERPTLRRAVTAELWMGRYRKWKSQVYPQAGRSILREIASSRHRGILCLWKSDELGHARSIHNCSDVHSQLERVDVLVMRGPCLLSATTDIYFLNVRIPQ